MEYNELCVALCLDRGNGPIKLRLVEMLDESMGQRFRILAPSDDVLWNSWQEPDLLDDEYLECIFTQAIESVGGTFEVLLG